MRPLRYVGPGRPAGPDGDGEQTQRQRPVVEERLLVTHLKGCQGQRRRPREPRRGAPPTGQGDGERPAVQQQREREAGHHAVADQQRGQVQPVGAHRQRQVGRHHVVDHVPRPGQQPRRHQNSGAPDRGRGPSPAQPGHHQRQQQRHVLLAGQRDREGDNGQPTAVPGNRQHGAGEQHDQQRLGPALLHGVGLLGQQQRQEGDQPGHPRTTEAPYRQHRQPQRHQQPPADVAGEQPGRCEQDRGPRQVGVDVGQPRRARPGLPVEVGAVRQPFGRALQQEPDVDQRPGCRQHHRAAGEQPQPGRDQCRCPAPLPGQQRYDGQPGGHRGRPGGRVADQQPPAAGVEGRRPDQAPDHDDRGGGGEPTSRRNHPQRPRRKQGRRDQPNPDKDTSQRHRGVAAVAVGHPEGDDRPGQQEHPGGGVDRPAVTLRLGHSARVGR